MKIRQWLLTAALVAAAPSAGALTIDAVDSGWYNANGVHTPQNQNYLAGVPFAGAPVDRNFFAFDLTGVTGTITGAVLRVTKGQASASGTYALWDVSTDVATVLAGSAGGAAGVGIYDDLGGGTAFGSGAVAATPQGTFYEDITLDFALNDAALASLNSANGLWALGGSWSGPGFVFGFTFGQIFPQPPTPTRQLILTVATVPEPGTFALLAMGVAFALAVTGRSGRRAARTA